MSSAIESPRRRWRTAVRWLVVAAIFAFIGRGIVDGWEELTEAHLSFRVAWLLASIVLLGLYMIGRALVWHYLTTLLGCAIPVAQAIMAWFHSQLGKYLPGKVFLYLGRLHYYTRHGQGAGRVSLAFGLELVATFSASILTVLIAALTIESSRIDALRPAMAGALAIFLLILHPRILTIVIEIAARILRRKPFPITLRYVELLRFVALYMVNWIVFGLSLYAFINSFFAIAPNSVLFLAGAFSLASLLGMVAILVPSGLGVREGVLGVFLIQLMPQPVALAAALAARIWFTMVELVGVAIVSIVAKQPAARPRALEPPVNS